MIKTTLVILVLALSAVCGCIQPPPSTMSGRVEELEGELKQERQRNADAQKQIDALRGERALLVNQLDEAKRMAAGSSGGQPGAYRFVATKVGFGWLTASVDWDNQGGDDGIQAFIVIQDQTGDSIKQAGAFELQLFDVQRDKEHAIETWTFTPEAAAKYWNTIPGGYLFKLPYANGIPGANEVVLTVKAKLSEGGEFSAQRTVRVRH